MKKITPELIRSFGPCYDPSEFLSEDYEATVLEFLNHPEIPVGDKFWVALREEFIDAKTLRLFAVWCARQALKLVENPHPASIRAVDVAEKYANGKATKDELAAARAAARYAAWDARAAAEAYAAWAARYAAWDAGAAAEAYAAWDTARAAAEASRAAQLKQLISIIEKL